MDRRGSGAGRGVHRELHFGQLKLEMYTGHEVAI